MKKHSSENYLDQLLNSMNDEDDIPKSAVTEEPEPVDSFVRELFGEPQTKEMMKAKDEEEFLREFEQDLLKDDIPNFADEFTRELGGIASGRQQALDDTDASIDDMIHHMNSYSQDTMGQDFDSMVDENAEFAGEIPEEPKPVVLSEEEEQQVETIKTLDQAVDAFDGAMEEAPMTNMDGLTELPVTEDGELDLSGMGSSDLMDILAEDSELSDLGDMLSPEGADVVVGEEDEIGSFAESEMGARMSELEAEELEDSKKGKKKKRKRKKDNAEKKSKSDKPDSFFSKISKLFFGEDEAEATLDLSLNTGATVSQLSDENQQILKELAAVGVEEEPKKEKGKKKKAKKEKKPKEEKPKKEKKPKAQKPKKEKKPKEVDNTPPLPKKPVIAIFVMVASLFGLVMLGVNLLGYQASINQAKELYQQESYIEAYQSLSGCEIKEKDLPLYNRLLTLAPVSSEYNTYLIFSNSGKHDKALDALVCAYGRYDENRSKAEEYGCMAELENIGGKVIKRLLEEYDMTGEEALEMYQAKNRKQYTIQMHEKLQELGLE